MNINRRIVPLIIAMTVSVFIATGVAVAATIQGGDGDNNITGTNKNDELYGGKGDDTLSGLAGSDNLRGQNGSDRLFGYSEGQTTQTDRDFVAGGDGQDLLVGSAGGDELNGGPGKDRIISGPYEDAAEDTVNGGDDNDNISVANLPASRDTVTCGTGTDTVVADSLDQITSDCEDVQRIQEEEPTLANGTYKLTPDPSSECSLGEGTVTISQDPASGEREAQVDLDESAAVNTAIQACSVEIDYENVSSAEGGEVSTQGSNTLTYEGTEPTQEQIDAAINGTEQPDQVIKEEGSASPPESEISTQYPWNVNKYTNVIQTYDPARLKLNGTRMSMRWWHNGSDVAFASRGGSCWADPLTLALTVWYTTDCYFSAGPYKGFGHNRRWIGSEGKGKYLNYNFGFDALATRANHTSLIEGYENGSVRWFASWRFSGEAWWLLKGKAYGFQSY